MLASHEVERVQRIGNAAARGLHRLTVEKSYPRRRRSNRGLCSPTIGVMLRLAFRRWHLGFVWPGCARFGLRFAGGARCARLGSANRQLPTFDRPDAQPYVPTVLLDERPVAGHPKEHHRSAVPVDAARESLSSLCEHLFPRSRVDACSCMAGTTAVSFGRQYSESQGAGYVVQVG
jgi:hypothetical protein